MRLFDKIFNKKKHVHKFDELNNLLRTMSIQKGQEIIDKINSGNFNNAEVSRAILFKDLELNEYEMEELSKQNYDSIESRLALLIQGKFFEEAIMIGIFFLTNKSDTKCIYDSNLRVKESGFLSVLFFTCISLHCSKK
jgi:hypothetical protein